MNSVLKVIIFSFFLESQDINILKSKQNPSHFTIFLLSVK